MSEQVHTHSNIEIYVSQDALNADLDLAGFKAIDNGKWIPIGAVGSVPERGIDTNMLSYDTVNTLVAKKAKGITDAGAGTLECAKQINDVGQLQLNAAGAPDNFNSYGIKLVNQDGTIEYNRCLIAGPSKPGGRNEDFDLANYALAFQQVPVTDEMADGEVTYTVTVTDALAFVLKIGSRSTAAIAAAETSSNVKAAIDALGVVSTVTGTAPTYTVKITGARPLSGIGATVTAA